MSRAPYIPPGSWPPRMSDEVAAGYCGEKSVECFLSRVGTEYPQPVVKRGKRRIWLKSDLDKAIGAVRSEDLADVL